ncbi:lamin tail domain-containing protein [Actinomadura hibisca]|uniref:lamin tail domain-containing protein n=1 Tax=Actinomadura hibisca TaxID=68565 RepID=UPI00082C355B|nr:lamin tail domain-containing protein [Actinomadura hibisca]
MLSSFPINRRVGAVAVLGVLVAGTALAGGAADAAGQTKRGGGTVTKVADGDTPYVGGKKPTDRVRLLGVQATETSHAGVGKTWCHGGEAKKALASLLVGKKVQLRSLRGGRNADGRLYRSVFRVDKGGRYLDVQAELLRRGLVIWHPTNDEWTYNRAYHVLADQAAAAKRRGTVWDDDWCGAGPSAGAKLRVWVNWDAPGDDSKNANGEYVVVKNDGPKGVSLAGWHMRDLSLQMYTFPRGAYLPPWGRVVLRVGKGKSTASTFYWGLSSPRFTNVGSAPGIGNGAYLLDPQGDFRAWFTYPCVVNCSDPLKGRISITDVHYDPRQAGEYVKLRLSPSAPRSSLEEYLLTSGSYTYRFPAGAYLNPGETVTVHTGSRPAGAAASRLDQYWGLPRRIFDKAGDSAALKTYREVRVACRSYGSGRC